jgi:hypothetical protein
MLIILKLVIFASKLILVLLLVLLLPLAKDISNCDIVLFIYYKMYTCIRLFIILILTLA